MSRRRKIPAKSRTWDRSEFASDAEYSAWLEGPSVEALHARQREGARELAILEGRDPEVDGQLEAASVIAAIFPELLKFSVREIHADARSILFRGQCEAAGVEFVLEDEG